MESFLLAQLHIDSLSKLRIPNQIRDAIQNLSNVIDRVYEQVLARIDEQDDDCKHLARKLLTWVAYSRVQLSVLAVQHALAIAPGKTKIEEWDICDQDTLTSICAGLVVIDKSSNVIRFVRESVPCI